MIKSIFRVDFKQVKYDKHAQLHQYILLLLEQNVAGWMQVMLVHHSFKCSIEETLLLAIWNPALAWLFKAKISLHVNDFHTKNIGKKRIISFRNGDLNDK